MIKNWDKIKDAADMVAIVGNYVQLKKSGVNYSGCCPFHEEKSPSFVVSPRKQNFVCYGCGKKGDIINFLMELKKMSFVEAAEAVAKSANIFPEYDKSREQTQADYEARKQESEYLLSAWEKVLPLIVPVPMELPERVVHAGREYSRKTAEDYLLGYHLPKAIFNGRETVKLSIEHLVKIGILKASQKHDGHYEPFANRDIFPVQDQTGRVIALGGRKTAECSDKSPKYLNSEESKLYNKSKTLYGLYQAQQEIIRLDRVIIVEGYTDVLTLADNGIRNVVATCGTSLTELHARVIGRYTDNITLLFDGDLAGQGATRRAVEILAPHCAVSVAQLPIDEPTPGTIIKTDPDEYTRKNGADAMRKILEDATDGIMWAIMSQWSKEDVHQQQIALKTAGQILAQLDETKRALYIKRLCDRKFLGSVKNALESEIDYYLAATLPQGLWSKDEEAAIGKYGIYEANNCYMLPFDEGRGTPLSNFIIASMTLVVGNRESERILEIIHSSGNVMQARIESEIFTNFSAFETWIESKGGYYFHEGAGKLWNKIRRYVVDRMQTVYPVTKLGWHREGFFVWRNGITVNGHFIPVGHNGIVTHEGINYMLTMSVSFINEKSDDVGKQATNQYFTFIEHSRKTDFVAFGQQMRIAYGTKSVVGLAFVVTSLFRDVVHEHEDYFPMLNIFGMPGSGKNKYFEMLISLWGVGGRFFDLTNTTEKALPRLFAQASNGITWLDEYRNELSDEMLAILTNAYNGSGRSMADYTGGTETKTFDVTNAVMISGEHRPTRRMALYTRCIAQETLTAEFSDETIAAYEHCREMSRTGGLTHVLADLLRYRSNVQEDFAEAFRQERNTLKAAFFGQKVEDRLIGNYSVICAVSAVLEKHSFALPFNIDVLRDECYKGILHQSRVIGSEDPVSSFWRIISFLFESKHLQHGTDLIIEDTSSIRVISSKDNTEEKVFPEPKRVMFIRLQKAHGLYLEYFQRQFRGQGLALGTLEHYLLTNSAFLGTCKGKKFGQSTMRCLVFDLSKIPVQFADRVAEAEADVL